MARQLWMSLLFVVAVIAAFYIYLPFGICSLLFLLGWIEHVLGPPGKNKKG
ncbi:MAG: hypothetical protein VCC01_01360 [Candidatus Hydrogenedentota bacterium]